MAEIIKQKYSSPKLEKALGTKFSDVSGLNASLPIYTKDVKKIEPAVRFNARGFVQPQNPETVFLTKDATLKTLGHEAEHSQQLLSDKFNEKNKIKADYIQSAGASWSNKDAKNAAVRKQIMQSAREAYEKYNDKYKLGSKFDENRMELMADMVGIESTLPTGQSVLDTDIGKEIFDTPEKRRWFLVSSFPNTTKLLEYNPGNYQIAVEKGRQALREFKDRSLHDSYFNAALAAIKKLASK